MIAMVLLPIGGKPSVATMLTHVWLMFHPEINISYFRPPIPPMWICLIVFITNAVSLSTDFSNPVITSTPVKPPRTYVSPPVSVDMSDDSTTETRPGVDEIHESKASIVRSAVNNTEVKRHLSRAQKSDSAVDGLYRKYQEPPSLGRLQTGSWPRRSNQEGLLYRKTETSSFTKGLETKPSASSLGSQASKSTVSPVSERTAWGAFQKLFWAYKSRGF